MRSAVVGLCALLPMTGCTILFDSDELLDGPPPEADAGDIDAATTPDASGPVPDGATDAGMPLVDAGPPPDPTTIEACSAPGDVVAPARVCVAFYDRFIITIDSPAITFLDDALADDITIATDAGAFYVGYLERDSGGGRRPRMLRLPAVGDSTLGTRTVAQLDTGLDPAVTVRSFAVGNGAPEPVFHYLGTHGDGRGGLWFGLLATPPAFRATTIPHLDHGSVAVFGGPESRHAWREPAGADTGMGARTSWALASVSTGTAAALAPETSYRSWEHPNVSDLMTDDVGAAGSGGELAVFSASDGRSLLLWDGVGIPARLDAGGEVIGHPDIAFRGIDADATGIGAHYTVAYRVGAEIQLAHLQCRTSGGTVRCCRAGSGSVAEPFAAFSIAPLPNAGLALVGDDNNIRVYLFEPGTLALRQELVGAIIPGGTSVVGSALASLNVPATGGGTMTYVVAALVLSRPGTEMQLLLVRSTSC